MINVTEQGRRTYRPKRRTINIKIDDEDTSPKINVNNSSSISQNKKKNNFFPQILFLLARIK